MTRTSAQAVIDRMESDEAFYKGLTEGGGPQAAQELLKAEGFEVTEQELRDALMDRLGDELTQEQLDALAGGAEYTFWQFCGDMVDGQHKLHWENGTLSVRRI